ncbi:MAG: hypothetical protein RMY28_004520 [Nostoc sp. ChiSLP01]|nr:hypothetical protein [Nostoc sp. CmiSLP01]MDZ8287594.1 hypothetical protein [Nostoc sp. ChiSLP01]
MHIFILCNHAQDILTPTNPIGHTLFILIVVSFIAAINFKIYGFIHFLIYAIALFIYTIQAVHRQNVTAFGGA